MNEFNLVKPTDNFDSLITICSFVRLSFIFLFFEKPIKRNMFPPIKRLRTDENQDESGHGTGGREPPAVPPPSTSMMDDFEMTDDELLFTATQVEQQTNYDYYQAQPASQNPSRSHLQAQAYSTQTVLQPLGSEINRTQNINKELELERKLLMKEGQIAILEKNNRLLSEKNARLYVLS